MKSIEERIVSMGFDNSNFEKHAAQSLATLEKIEGALGTLGSISGDTLQNALVAVTDKFSVLGTIGDEVLRKLADGLMDVANKGLSLAKSLSIDQIASGWSKYADKTQAVQTIMAATSKDWTDTGAQMEYVNSQLDKLNWFTDETSYSFLDMVNNIGKFTSNGIGLEESVTAMEGISTWAAISGANVNEAGRAMYNLSQALATGSVKLIDWKSIESANMSTREFKETALETAVSLGTLTKATDAQGNAIYRTAKGHEFAAEQFNTYLSDAWFSKEVLTSTLNQYGEYANVLHDVSEATGMTATSILSQIDAYQKATTEEDKQKVISKELIPYLDKLTAAEYDLGRRAFIAAQEAKTFKEAIEATKDAVSTGWMNTFESIFGNYEEAKVLWTSLANGLWEVFASGGETRNLALKLWRELGDRAKLFNDEVDKYGDKVGKIYVIGRKFLELFDELHGGLLKVFGPDVDPGEHDEDVYQLYTIFSKLTDKIVNFSDAFEEFTDKIIETDTINRIFSSFRAIYLGIKEPIDALKNTFHTIFDPADFTWATTLALTIEKISLRLRVASEHFKDFMQDAERIKEFYDIGYGIMAIFEIAVEFIKEAQKQIEPLLKTINWVWDDIPFRLSQYGVLIQMLKNTLINTGALARVAEVLSHVFLALFDAVDLVVEIASAFIVTFIEHLRVFGGLLNGILDVVDSIALAFDHILADDGEIFGWEKIINDAFDLFKSFFKYLARSDVQEDLRKIGRAIMSVFEIAGMTIKTVWNEFKKLVPGFKTSFQTLFHDFASLTDWITKIKNGMKESGSLQRIIETLTNVLQDLGAATQIVYEIFKGFFKIIGDHLHIFDGLGGSLLDVVNKFADWVIQLRDSKDWGDKTYKTFSSVANILETVVGWVTKLTEFIIKKEPLAKLTEWAEKAGEKIGEAFKKIKIGWNKLFHSDGSKADPVQIITSLTLGILALKKIFKKKEEFSLVKWLFGDNVVESFNDVLKGIKGGLERLVKKDDIISKLRNLAISLGILAVSIGVIAAIDTDKIATSLATLATGLAGMVGTLKFLDMLKVSGKSATNLIKVAAALLIFAFAIGEVAMAMLVLSAACWVMSKIDPDRLWSTIGAMATVLGAVTAALLILAKICKGGAVLAAGTAILEVALALDLIAIALLALAFVPQEKIMKSITDLTEMLVVMVAAIGLLSLAGAKSMAAATALLELSVGLIAIAAAFIIMSFVPADKLVDSFAALAGMLLVMMIALGILSTVALPAMAVGAAFLMLGAGLVLGAAALLILAEALKVMKPVVGDIPEIAGGLALLGLAMIPLAAGAIACSLGLLGFAGLAVLALGLRMMNGMDLYQMGSDMVFLGAGLIVLGVAGVALTLGAVGLAAAGIAFIPFSIGLMTLASGIRAMSGISLEDMASVAAGLALIGLAGVPLLAGAAGILVGAPALVALAAVLPELATGIKSFETVDWDEIKKAGAILAETILALFALQFATILNGIPVLREMALTMPILAMGFKTFELVDGEAIARAGEGLSKAIKALFALQFSTFKDGTEQLAKIGVTMPILALGFMSFKDLDADNIVVVGDALARTIKALFSLQFASFKDGTAQLTNLGNALPPLADGFKAFDGLDGSRIVDLCDSLEKGLKTLSGNFIKNLFRGDIDFSDLANGLLMLASAVNAIPENAEAILTGLSAGITDAAKVAVQNIEDLATKILLDLQTMVDKADGITKELVPNMTKAVNINKPIFANALRGCVTSLQIQLSAMETVLTSSINSCSIIVSSGVSVFYDYGYQMGSNLANGIYDSVYLVQNAARALQEAAQVENTNNTYNVGQQAATGYANGMTNTTSTKTVTKASNNIVKTSIDTLKNKLKVRSPSRVMMEIGAYVTKGFANGIQNGSDGVEDAMVTVINPVLAALSQLMNEDYDFSPTIKPVVDMSNVDAMSGDIASLFGGNPTYTVNAARRVSANESAYGGSFGNYNSVGDTINASINVYAQAGQDVNELARVIERRLVRLNKQQQVGAL